MTAAGLVVGWVVLVVGALLAVAWWSRRQPVPPPRDSELPSTDHLDSGPRATWAAMPTDRVWADQVPPPWQNTVPSGPMPLDEAPWDQAVKTMNGATPRRRRDDGGHDTHPGVRQADSEGGEP